MDFELENKISDAEAEVQAIIDAGESATGTSLLEKFSALKALYPENGRRARLVSGIISSLSIYAKEAIKSDGDRNAEKEARKAIQEQQAIEDEKQRLFDEAYPDGYTPPPAE